MCHASKSVNIIDLLIAKLMIDIIRIPSFHHDKPQNLLQHALLDNVMIILSAISESHIVDNCLVHISLETGLVLATQSE